MSLPVKLILKVDTSKKRIPEMDAHIMPFSDRFIALGFTDGEKVQDPEDPTGGTWWRFFDTVSHAEQWRDLLISIESKHPGNDPIISMSIETQ